MPPCCIQRPDVTWSPILPLSWRGGELGPFSDLKYAWGFLGSSLRVTRPGSGPQEAAWRELQAERTQLQGQLQQEREELLARMEAEKEELSEEIAALQQERDEGLLLAESEKQQV